MAADALGPLRDGVGGVHGPLTRVAGVTDQARRPASQHDRPVAGPLEALQSEQWHQVSGVQAGRGRVETGVHRHRRRRGRGGECVDIGGLRDESAPRQFIENRRGHLLIFPHRVRSVALTRPWRAGTSAIRRYFRVSGKPESPVPIGGKTDPDPGTRIVRRRLT